MILRDYQIDIVNKTRNSFKQYNRPLVVLPCGAGKTVCFADMAKKHLTKSPTNNVWFLVHRQELVDQTLDALGGNAERIFVGMVQTISSKIKRGLVTDKPTLIIFDEAHHATAMTWQRVIEYFDNVPMVGLTATPKRLNGDALSDIFDTLIEGVDADWLIQNNYLAPYEYYAPPMRDIELKIKGQDFDMDDFSIQLMKSKIYGDVSKYIRGKTIIYCPSIQVSTDIASVLGATHFDGNTSKAERRRIVEQFKRGDIQVLTNVDLIGEGFDVPDCDTVILMRPTQSLSLYIQQSMRCMRYRDGKIAHIYDLVGNVYRHGMPTEKRKWNLHGRLRVRNATGEPDIIVRECKQCLRAYSGISPICPYCGNDNGLTKKQIEVNEQVELERIKSIERKQRKSAYTMEELVRLGEERGYKNPYYWAKMVMKGRGNR